MHRDWLQAYRHSLRIPDMHGITPLEAARSGGFTDIVDCLEDAEKRCGLSSPRPFDCVRCSCCTVVAELYCER